MTLPLTRISLSIVLLGAQASAMAQQSDSKAQSPTPTRALENAAVHQAVIAKVEVKGSAESYDARREDTASKTVLNHEEITRYGDTNVFDVLKRAPGVTVIGNSIRMRGLGNGYTQVLVNGVAPPPGFSMESLTPEQIDKIEVMRSATAEHSTQAIAGTINLVLSKVVSKPQRDLRLNIGHARDQHNATAIGTWADRRGNLSYYINAMMSNDVDRLPSMSVARFSAPGGEVLQLRERHNIRQRRKTNVGIQPRLNLKFDTDDQLNVNAYLEKQRSHDDLANRTVVSQGVFASPYFPDSAGRGQGDVLYAGIELNWVAKLWGGKLDARISTEKSHTTGEDRRLSSSADRTLNLSRDTDSETTFRDVRTSGKYKRSMFDGHLLAAGWEFNTHQAEERIDRLEGLFGTAPVSTHETFEPRVLRGAVFAQDEWNLSTNWSIYLGGRWEGIRTESNGRGVLASVSRSSVFSPIAQTLYKFPDKSGRQVRMALTRTYRAPTTNMLSARRYESDQNDRFNPDNSGNPNLRPELAAGFDLTYEHFWAPGAVYSAGWSIRRITDYMRNRLMEDAKGHWLIQPMNNGNAQVRTLDLEMKFPLKALMIDPPPLEMRASVNRNWSAVDNVPGPNNRLDQQVPLTAVLGLDYKGERFSVGANYAFRAGGPVQISQEQSSQLQTRRVLDGYILYRIRPGVQLWTGVKNALGEDNVSEGRYADVQGVSRTWNWTRGSPKFLVNLEVKL